MKSELAVKKKADDLFLRLFNARRENPTKKKQINQLLKRWFVANQIIQTI